jgi:Skp family chaperone for outer membrane proteins
VKRMILIGAGVAALALVYFGSQLLAQGQAGAGAAPTLQGTRVGVVNIGTVFTSYKKATAFKQEMEEAGKPFKLQIEAYQKDIFNLKNDASKPGSKITKEDAEAQIVAKQRAIEDMQRQARAVLGKKAEAQLVQLWREINDVIDRAAKANSFNIVLAFGDPADAAATGLTDFTNINRKLNAIEMGSTAPLYFDRSVDLTGVVVQTLNAGFGGAQGSPTSAPRPGGQ